MPEQNPPRPAAEERCAQPVILRVPDVGQLLGGWSDGQVLMAVRRGQLPARRLGRRIVFVRQELLEHLAHLPLVAPEEQ